MAVFYEYLYYTRVFVPGKPFQPSLMFARKVGDYPVKESFRWSAQGQAPRRAHKLGKKGLPGTNALAYYEKS